MGSLHDWKRTVVCRLLYHVPSPLSLSPDVRYQLNGHQSVVGHELASSAVQEPQCCCTRRDPHTADGCTRRDPHTAADGSPVLLHKQKSAHSSWIPLSLAHFAL